MTMALRSKGKRKREVAPIINRNLTDTTMASTSKGKRKKAVAPTPRIYASSYLNDLATTHPKIALDLFSFEQAEDELEVIHADILKMEDKFVQERNKWVKKNRKKYRDKNQFFEKRCDWESKFKTKHLHPLYVKMKPIAASETLRHDFWRQAVCFHKYFSNLTTDEDFEALKFLENIECSRTSNYKGFKLTFTFDKENPYFSNEFLTKTYEVADDDNGFFLLQAIGDKIQWIPPHNLTVDKHGKRLKSFFHFFKSYAYLDPLNFDIETDKLIGDTPKDYEIGIMFRDVIIPHAISCFNCSERDPYDGKDEDDDDGWFNGRGFMRLLHFDRVMAMGYQPTTSVFTFITLCRERLIDMLAFCKSSFIIRLWNYLS